MLHIVVGASNCAECACIIWMFFCKNILLYFQALLKFFNCFLVSAEIVVSIADIVQKYCKFRVIPPK